MSDHLSPEIIRLLLYSPAPSPHISSLSAYYNAPRKIAARTNTIWDDSLIGAAHKTIAGIDLADRHFFRAAPDPSPNRRTIARIHRACAQHRGHPVHRMVPVQADP